MIWAQLGAINSSLIAAAGNSSTTQEYSFSDITANVYENSYYWLEIVNLDGTNSFHGPTTYNPEEDNPTPDTYEFTKMEDCFPNPVKSTVTIDYQLKGSADNQNATIKVYNVLGELVKTVKGENGEARIWYL